MKPIAVIQGVAAPLFEANIDTDVIIPSREMKQVSKVGLMNGLFAGRRYLDFTSRQPNPDFVLNKDRYKIANILLVDSNFGCGSSREHAVWALKEYGIEAIIAPSFSPIFYKNCCNNGLLPVTLEREEIKWVLKFDGRPVTIDLPSQIVRCGDKKLAFSIQEDLKQALLKGLDPIDLTLELSSEIQDFEEAHHARLPWSAL